MDWIITVPKTTPWEEYQQELDAVSDGSCTMNYRVPYKPKEMKAGDRCFVTWNGKVRGWMKITDIWNSDGFTCTTTGKVWPAGWYVSRSGKFNVTDGPLYPGFRGYRKYA